MALFSWAFLAFQANIKALMQPMRRAVIDVGTNSVKLLVADVRGLDLQPVLEKSEQTRLGRGLYETHSLQRGAIQETAEAVGAFVKLAAQWESAAARLIATSAARDARNQDELNGSPLQGMSFVQP